MRVAAAHFRIVLDETLAQPSLEAPRSLVVRASRASFAVHSLPEGYALVICLARGAGFRGLGRAVPVCIRSLAERGGWAPPSSPWHAVDVVSSTPGARLAQSGQARGSRALGPRLPLEVLGRYRVGLPEHERAWRVRLPSGVEFTLVRESGGFWYADEPVTPARSRPPGRSSGPQKKPLTGGVP